MKYILTLFLSSGLLSINAQEIISKDYFNKKNIKVDNIDSAYYTREITSKDASGFYKIKEEYLNRQLKSEGQASNYNPYVVYEGIKTSYHLNGVKEAEEDYKKGQKVGYSKRFYQNGNLKEHLVYFDNVVRKPGIEVLTYRTIQIADSLGKTFLDEKRNGIVDLKLPSISEEYGEYVNGFKNGIWKTHNLIKNEKYEDIYENGKYIEGKTIKPDGSIITYKTLEKLPEFTGGLDAFGKFLSQNLTYPPTSRQNKIQGRVYVGFVVQRDGSITDIKVLRGVSEDIDKEALRVMKKSPKWIPGIQRGIPVRVSYTVPIFFQLAS